MAIGPTVIDLTEGVAQALVDTVARHKAVVATVVAVVAVDVAGVGIGVAQVAVVRGAGVVVVEEVVTGEAGVLPKHGHESRDWK